jgi:hypothetical protein
MDPQADIESRDIFQVSSAVRIRKLVATVVQRLHCGQSSEISTHTPMTDDAASTTSESGAQTDRAQEPAAKSLDQNTLPLHEQLRQAVAVKMASVSKPQLTYTVNDNINIQNALTTVKKQMSLFEGGGSKGSYLQMAYDCLLTIPPTSVESERAFSSAGYICSKIRSSLSDKTLDDLLFLRTYLKKK